MTQHRLVYLIPGANQLVQIPVQKLSEARAIIDSLDLSQVSGVRISHLSDRASDEVITHRLEGRILQPMPQPHELDLGLYNADPDCLHDEQVQPGGGVRCSRCAGWFCF